MKYKSAVTWRAICHGGTEEMLPGKQGPRRHRKRALLHCGPSPLAYLDVGLTDQIWTLMPFSVSTLSQSGAGGSRRQGVRDTGSDVQAPYEGPFGHSQ